jgi:PAS domain S-box-containing protein
MNDRASPADSAEQTLAEQSRLLESNEQDFMLLQQLAVELVGEENPQAIYEAIVDAATRLMKSQFASMQMVVAGTSPPQLKLLASRGFDEAAQTAWDIVTPESASSCSVAMGRAARAIIPDFEKADPAAVNIPAYLGVGIRAAQSTPLFSRGGELVGMISTHWSHPHRPAASELRNFDILARQCADLLERRRAEIERARSVAELRQREAELAHAQRVGCMGSVDVDLTGAMVGRRSPEYLRIHGLGPEAVNEPHEVFLARLHPEDRERVDREFRAAVAGDAAQYENEYRIRRPVDGEERWIAVRADILRGPDGRALRLLGAHIDVTERKQEQERLRRSEERLREADRRKDEFLAILAHELRNPLAPVRTAVALLKRLPQGKQADVARDIIDRQVTGLARLIDDLMDISRISQGKIQLRKEPASLSMAILNAVEATRPLMEAARQSLAITITPEPLQVHGDPARLVQVFTNLLNNASKYSPDGSGIELSAAVEEGVAVVSVRDHGVGIPHEELDRIWEMFVQSDRSLERRHGGLGVGLHLVRSLVHLHGGTVSAASEGAGKGSTFSVRLPLDSNRPVREAPAASSESIPRLRILVADDNIDAAKSLGMLLEVSGCEVETAYDGEAALEIASRFRPDVALLDVGMPKVNGYELARRIKQEAWGRGMTLVAVTGWGQAEDRRRSGEAGFDRHLVKPVSMDSLRSLLLVESAGTR